MTNVLRGGTTCLFLVVITLLSIQPIGFEAQLVFTVLSIGVLLIISRLKKTIEYRFIFFAIIYMIAVRYLYWRLTSTLPPAGFSISEITNFLPALMLLLAESFAIFMLFINMFVTAQPVKRQLNTRRTVLSHHPTVDVFIPTYDEDEDILAMTLAAAVNLDYPKERFNVYLLDDGGTVEKVFSRDGADAKHAWERREKIKRLCNGLGVNYLTRALNDSAKAGNLNLGLQNSSGEFIAVLDADHAPSKDFLKKTVGNFLSDEKLFLVQTPHFFMNPDPVEKNLQTGGDMPSEHELFYSVTQRGLDKWNATFFCGSGAVLRRSALETVDGFGVNTVTEDCETSLKLHARGWHSMYLDEPLIVGFQPQTFASFIAQRTRWCQGMMQILLTQCPLLVRGLNLRQRLAYLSSLTFWLFPLPRLMFMLAPMFFILGGMEVYRTTAGAFLVMGGGYFAASVLAQRYIYAGARWPWLSEIYEFAQSIHLVGAISSVLVNPKRPVFKVTRKGETLGKDQISNLAWPFFLFFVAALLTSIVGIYRLYITEGDIGLLAITVGWSIFNLIIATAVIGVVSERRDERRHYRFGTAKMRPLAVLQSATSKHVVTFDDVSIGGAALACKAGLPDELGQCVLHLLDRETRKLVHSLRVDTGLVREKNGVANVGVRFVSPTANDRMAIASLMLPDNTTMREVRNERRAVKPFWKMTLTVLQLTGQNAVRAFSLLGSAAGQMVSNKPAAAAATVALLLPLILFASDGAAREQYIRKNVPLTRYFANREIETIRLSGGHSTFTVPFFISEMVPGNVSRLVIPYHNAASVMPEGSTLSAWINGKRVAGDAIWSPAGIAEMEFEIPTDLFVSGFNSLTIAADQVHRVDCSVNASYELWTDIELNGARFEHDERLIRFQGLEKLAGLPLGKDGRHHIRLIIGGQEQRGEGQEAINLAVKMLQQAYLVKPHVEVVLFHELELVENQSNPGVDIFYGPSVNEMPAFRYLANPDRVFFSYLTDRQQNIRKIEAVISGPDMAPVRLASLDDMPLAGSVLGLNALRQVRERGNFSIGTRYLTEIMPAMIPAKGKSFTQKMPVHLPSDYFSGNYDFVRLKLDGRITGNIAEKLNLAIKVNDELVGSHVQRASNAALSTYHEISLANFRPGLNTIELMGSFHHQAKAACDPIVALNNQPSFSLSPQSTLTLPRVARVQTGKNRLSNLLPADFREKTSDDAKLNVWLADVSTETLSATAETIFYAANRLHIPFEIALTSRTQSSPGDADILVGEFNHLPNVLQAELASEEVRRVALLEKKRPQQEIVPVPSASERSVAALREAALPDLAGDEEEANSFNDIMALGVDDVATAAINPDAIDPLSSHDQEISHAELSEMQPSMVWQSSAFDRSQKLVVAPQNPLALWELIEDSERLAKLSAPEADKWVISSYHPLNLRLVIGGVVSSHPVLFSLFALLIATASGLLVCTYCRQTDRRDQKTIVLK